MNENIISNLTIDTTNTVEVGSINNIARNITDKILDDIKSENKDLIDAIKNYVLDYFESILEDPKKLIEELVNKKLEEERAEINDLRNQYFRLNSRLINVTASIDPPEF